MKKFVLPTVAAIILIVAGYNYWPNLQQLYFKIKGLGATVSGSSVVEKIKSEISAPPPLLGSLGDQTTQLTQFGVISQTNAQRQQQGLRILQESSKLDQAAQSKLNDMFSKQYFEHISPSGVGPADLAKAAGYEYIAIGENLALGNFKDDPGLVAAWMNSPGHRANILSTSYTEIGVAVGQGEYEGHKTWIAVQEFGRPASSCPVVDSSLKSQIDSLTTQTDKELAQINSQKAALDSMQPKTRSEYEQYNNQAAQFNSLVNTYNAQVAQLKSLIDRYNTQVRNFNACIGR